MDPFSYARAAASLGRNCLSTLQALYNLHEKYIGVRQTVEALHREIAAIGVSMQFINDIFEKNPDMAKTRFYQNPNLEQTFAAAIAGCSLVLSCLDEEVEKILIGIGPVGSKGRKGKARYLWKEETMNGLLQTLRGQHSAIFSIVQCLQVLNIAELGMKIEELRVIVSGNHQSVEYAVGRSPSIHKVQRENPSLLDVVSESKYTLHSSTDSAFEDFEDNESTNSSSEKVARSYKQYHATMFNFAKESMSRNDDESGDDAASLRGLAPSTVRASDPSKDDDIPSDRQSIISAVSNSSWTRRWLETQLGTEETAKTLKRMESTISSQMSSCETGNSIVASDMQTFLEYIRYFMPVLADFDAEEQGRGNAFQSVKNESGFDSRNMEDNPSMDEAHSTVQGTGCDEDVSETQGSSSPIEATGSEITHQLGQVSDTSGNQVVADIELALEGTYETAVDLPPNSHDFSSPGKSLSESREGRNSRKNWEDNPQVSESSIEDSITRDVPTGSDTATQGSTSKAMSMPRTSTGLSIYVEKRSHRRGTVICTPNGDDALRVSNSWAQALAQGTQGSESDATLPSNMSGEFSDGSKQSPPLLRRISMGARVFSVQKSTHQEVSLEESQDQDSESESETFSGNAHVHMEGPLLIVSAAQRWSKGNQSRAPSIESPPSDFG